LKTLRGLIDLDDDHKILQNLVALNADTSDCVVPLVSIALLLNAKHILELGVRTGISTRALLVVCRKLNGTLISFDIDPCQEACQKIMELGLQDRWQFLQCDDKELLEVIKPRSIDLIFLDTDHDLSHTVIELGLCDKVLKKGGVILVHDTLAPAYADINKAIAQFMEKHKKTYRFYELGTRYGLSMLVKKAS